MVDSAPRSVVEAEAEDFAVQVLVVDEVVEDVVDGRDESIVDLAGLLGVFHHHVHLQQTSHLRGGGECV